MSMNLNILTNHLTIINKSQPLTVVFHVINSDIQSFFLLFQNSLTRFSSNSSTSIASIIILQE